MEALAYGVVGARGRMGQEVIKAFGPQGLCLQVWRDGQELLDRPQVICDFSSPAALPRTVELCRRHSSALVMGTTALTEDHLAQLRELASQVPVVQSFNYSIGVALMAMMLRHFGPLLAQWDAEISETHHVHKKDAPSGTALMLQAALGREVPIRSSRLGGVPGDHSASFANSGEVLQISHRALSRSVFAIGALQAARFAVGQDRGFFTFQEVLRNLAQ